MKENKMRILMFFAIAVLLILLAVAAMFLLKNKSEPKQNEGKKTEEEQTDVSEDLLTGLKLEFENFKLLDAYFSEQEQQEIQQKIRNFLKQESCYRSVTEVTCQDATIEKIQTIEFYCLLNDEKETVLHCFYEKDSGVMEIQAEDIEKDVLEQKRRENTETFLEDTPDSGELPSEWEYVEELELPLHLTGKETLSELIPEESLEALDQKILQFLAAENEFRREVEIVSDSIQNLDKSVEFFVLFKTPRIDEKGIKIVYDKGQGEYRFMFYDLDECCEENE